jgi:RimJ/RimL family protein N-acetyltransferase
VRAEQSRVRAEQSRVRVARVRPEDWAEWKAIRLEALEDTPIGFLEQLAGARTRTDAQWQERTTAAAAGNAHGLWLARGGDRVIGCTGGLRYEPGSWATVYSVYVTPSARGGEVLDRLLDAVVDWAQDLDGVSELRLEVHEDNARARAAYVRRGFVETGGSTPYPPDPTRRELEMARPLSP